MRTIQVAMYLSTVYPVSVYSYSCTLLQYLYASSHLPRAVSAQHTLYKEMCSDESLGSGLLPHSVSAFIYTMDALGITGLEST